MEKGEIVDYAELILQSMHHSRFRQSSKFIKDAINSNEISPNHSALSLHWETIEVEVVFQICLRNNVMFFIHVILVSN